MNALCQHTLLEYHDCDAELLKRDCDIRALLLAAVRRGGGTIVTDVFHLFSPFGVSGVVVIAESHVTIHTWPEHEYAAVDIFSCSGKLDHNAIREHLQIALRSGRVLQKTLERGNLPELQPRASAAK
jgi:S-adenosylmethionine decarboxylase proenzyme